MISQTTARHIQQWPIDRLIPYARNPRTHSDAQVAQIAASIVEFGWTSPILVDTQSGVLAGHGRLLAARKLKLAEVPVIVLDHLTEAQKRAYILADNSSQQHRRRCAARAVHIFFDTEGGSELGICVRISAQALADGLSPGHP